MNNNVMSRWDSPAEKLVYNFLGKYINTDFYSIDVHVNLDRVFPDLHRIHSFQNEYNNFCDFMNRSNMKDNVKFDKMHFDFVIYEKEHDFPVLIIEVNGKTHITEKSKKHIDQFKYFIASKYDIPLRTIELFYSYSEKDIDTLLYMLLINATVPGNYPAYCICGTRLLYKSAKHTNNGLSEIKYYYQCPNCIKSNGKQLTYNLTDIPNFLV